MKAVRVRGFVDGPRSVERVVDLSVIAVGHGLACSLTGDPWNNASQSATAFAIIAFLLFSEIAGLYGRRPGGDLSAQARLAPRVWAATLPLLLLFQVLSSAAWHSLVAAIWAVAAGAGMFAWRLGLRRLAAAAKLRQSHNVAILGGTQSAERLCAEIEDRPWLRMRLVGIFDDRSIVRMSRAAAALRRGNVADLVDACKRRLVDTVIVALPTLAQARVAAVVEALADTTATVFLLADLPSLDLLNATWTAIGGVPLVGLGDNHVGSVTMNVRRALGTAAGRVSPALAARFAGAPPLEPLLVHEPDAAESYVASAVFSPAVVVDPSNRSANAGATDATTVGPSV